MKRWWIGCSGFYYKAWREAFYPKNLPQRKWFEFYCESFNTVELNVTFYRFPRVRDLKSWFDKSPDEFVFTVKAPRLITHYKKFKNVGRELHQFYDTVNSGLEYKLGPILFQLHPKIFYSEEKLQQILEAIDTSFINVIEFRDKSWWRKDVMDTLKKHNIAFCGMSYPGLPDAVHSTAPFLYYRFHGVPKLYLSSYRDTELAKVIGDIKSVRGVDDVFIYFNNDIEVAAVHNAKTVQQLI
jgi:uncharacterized protein YecE (DUF72 family)